MAGRPVRGDRHFVGRDHELAAIAEGRAMARAGHVQLIVVTGEAGIGKTTLCERASVAASAEGFAVAWGRCWDDGGSPPLWPWSALLAELGGPRAAGLLSGVGARTGLDPDRFGRFTAVSELLGRLADEQPLLIVIDDFHVADTAALLLARFLVRSLDGYPVVMLMARRPLEAFERSEQSRLVDELERDALSIRLRSFDERDTAAYLAARGVRVEDYGLVPALARLTSGNPLLLARAVAHVPPSGELTGVEHVIGDAIDVLSPEHRDVVALAAVLGIESMLADVAALLGGEPSDVHEALESASAAGLLDVVPGGWRFTHELVRRAALRTLTPREVLDAHARAAELAPCDDRPAAVARRAHHALAAAARSEEDAERAVTRCREAAGVLSAGFDYERAAALMDAAVELATRLTTPPAHVDLLLEWAEALQVCGRLAAAREAYERAVAAAESADDIEARARAALGLGGVWVDEHRGQAARQRVLGLQRSALAALAPDARALRARLKVRLAAEAVYDDAPVEPVFAALAEARQVGDPRAVAEALSLSHHALLAPEHLAVRTPIAEELISVAAATGDSLRVLFGLLWKAVDLYHAGDPAADRTLAELRQRADAVGCRSICYIVAAIDVMRLIRDGRLDAAESAADDCFALGADVGDADATGYYGVHLLTIRWLQERDAELLDLAREIAASDTLVTPEFAFRAGAAAIAARAGRVDEANAGLRQLREGGGLAALPRSSTWLAGMVIVMEAAWALGDAEVAREVYPLLEPFADRPAMPSLAVSCFGAVERALGLAACTWGDLDRAVDHLERAVLRNAALGHRPMTALARADLATALARRAGPGDRPAALENLAGAAELAEALGMDARAVAWREIAAQLAEATDAAVLRRDGTRWVVDVDDRCVVVPDLVGLSYIGSLLARPGDEIEAVDLCGGTTVEGSSDDVIDRDALAAYRRRVRQIDDLLEVARHTGRASRVARLEAERDELRRELSHVLSLQGRARQFAHSGERARTAVRKAITRAIDVIGASDHDLGAELRSTITTGRRCSYVPDPRRPRRWHVVVDS